MPAVILIFLLVINHSGLTWEMGIFISFGFMASRLPIAPAGLRLGVAGFNKLIGILGLKDLAVMLLGWRLLTLLIDLVFFAETKTIFF